MKKVLITGKNSYIGTALRDILTKQKDKYKVEMIDLKNSLWINNDFSSFDVVFHVAAVVHQKEKPEMKELYFSINRDLSIEVAKKAKNSGIKQFIFMSTMAVYGKEGKIGEDIIINHNTPLQPKSFYALSKLEAELELEKLQDDKFSVLILRPPMVYGPNCPGNYARLEKFAIKSPIFPLIDNKRSMVQIDKLCQTIKKCIDEKTTGILFPQDEEYINTSLMVAELAKINGKSIHLSKTAGIIVKLIGKRVDLINKIFGNLVYEK